jgi:hypothetical protein
MISFFVILSKVIYQKEFKKITYGCLYFSIGLFIDDVLIFASIGSVSSYFYEIGLLILTILGYVYGTNINRFAVKNLWHYLDKLFYWGDN